MLRINFGVLLVAILEAFKAFTAAACVMAEIAHIGWETIAILWAT